MSWPLGLQHVFLGHYLVLWQEQALQHLFCPITTPKIMPDARDQPDPQSVPHCPQQGLVETHVRWEAHALCLGPPPSHCQVVPSHDLVGGAARSLMGVLYILKKLVWIQEEVRQVCGGKSTERHQKG